MALRRQVGADAVDIDTETEILRFAHSEPAQFDFAMINESVDDAGYTLKGIRLEVEGEIVSTDCQTCAGEVAALRIPATGQELELVGSAPIGESGRLFGRVTDWAGAHPRITIQEWQSATR